VVVVALLAAPARTYPSASVRVASTTTQRGHNYSTVMIEFAREEETDCSVNAS
jgi:hypothetical protein